MSSEKKKGRLFVISAPSGSGKTTLCSRLIKKMPQLCLSISVTTRKPRKSEVYGRDYIFISEKEFLRRRKSGQFLEWAKVLGNFYGTLKGPVYKALSCGKDVILNIDVQGAMKVKRRHPDGTFIFILPPSLKALRRRLIGRSTEPDKEIKRRLTLARKELACSKRYEYRIVNDRLENAINKLKEIIAYTKN